MEVTLEDLSQVNQVIDMASQSGANVIQKLQYRLKNPATARGQALKMASEEGKAGVEAMAAGLGAKVIRVLSAEEVIDEDFGAYKKAPAPAPGNNEPTPLEAGMIEITVTVLVRAQIGQ